MSDYLFGNDDQEFDRLRHQHEVWLPWTREHLAAGRLRHGDVVLDLGCGPGFVSAEMESGGARVLAFDRDAKSLDALRTRCAENDIDGINVLPPGDATSLPALPERPTVVYIRWLLCYLGRERTEGVIRDLSRRIDAGSRVLIHDYVNYRSVHLEPSSEAFRAMIDIFSQELADADIGFALPAILGRCGFRLSWKRVVQLALVPDEEAWAWPDRFFRLHVKSRPGAKEFLRDWDEATADPTAIFYSWPVLQLVAIKT